MNNQAMERLQAKTPERRFLQVLDRNFTMLPKWLKRYWRKPRLACCVPQAHCGQKYVLRISKIRYGHRPNLQRTRKGNGLSFPKFAWSPIVTTVNTYRHRGIVNQELVVFIMACPSF